jgi:hypothetical protein
MKSLITKGKYKGIVAEIGQYCNDWFTLDTGTEIDRKIFSPSSLAFNLSDITEISSDKGAGIMMGIFEIVTYHDDRNIDGPVFNWTFKKRKL